MNKELVSQGAHTPTAQVKIYGLGHVSLRKISYSSLLQLSIIIGVQYFYMTLKVVKWDSINLHNC